MESTVPAEAIRKLTPEQVTAATDSGCYCWNIDHVKGEGWFVVSPMMYIGNAMNTSELGGLTANVRSKFVMVDGKVYRRHHHHQPPPPLLPPLPPPLPLLPPPPLAQAPILPDQGILPPVSS
jgi:hypothetical protein